MVKNVNYDRYMFIVQVRLGKVSFVFFFGVRENVKLTKWLGANFFQVICLMQQMEILKSKLLF